MISHDFLKRTPVRLAAAFAILFAVTVVALVGLLYITLVSELDGSIRQHVEEISDTLQAIDRQQGFVDLTAVVTEEAESVRDFDSIFLLRADDGSVKAGNVQNVALFEGWGELDRAWLPMVASKGNPDDRFFAKWTKVSQGHLLVGGSDREIREVRRILLHGLGWGLSATMLLAAGSAFYLARRAQQKIDVFATTLSKVSRGQIGERVPVTASHDDLDHVATQINATLAHLQKLIESVNQASSDIAHDLKKPIGRLRRRLEIALRSDDTNAFRRQVEEALEELDSIVETFEALLRITQLEAGARRARFGTLDLGSVIADVADIYEPVVEEAGDRLVSRVTMVQGIKVTGDRELLTQLFANLIENAVRHSSVGTRIDVALERRGDRHVATIADTGPGIPIHERENVFRRLYRLERERSTPGSGLGLSLVAAIAELHGATVTLLDNAPGLRVEVSFPRATALPA
jgi:signal transduction histidine kinase